MLPHIKENDSPSRDTKFVFLLKLYMKRELVLGLTQKHASPQRFLMTNRKNIVSSANLYLSFLNSSACKRSAPVYMRTEEIQMVLLAFNFGYIVFACGVFSSFSFFSTLLWDGLAKVICLYFTNCFPRRVWPAPS